MLKKFVRFIFVGVMNSLFGYFVFTSCIFIGMRYPQALLMTTILGALFNFKSIGQLVFKKGENNRLFRFLAVYAVTYFLNYHALKFLDDRNISMYIAALIIAGPMAVVSFLLFNRFVFAGNATDVVSTDRSIP